MTTGNYSLGNVLTGENTSLGGEVPSLNPSMEGTGTGGVNCIPSGLSGKKILEGYSPTGKVVADPSLLVRELGDDSDMADVRELEKFEETRGKLRLPPDAKPCLVRLMEECLSLREGNHSFVVACELNRIGMSRETIESKLVQLGVRYSKARDSAKSAATGKYGYGCLNLAMEGICLQKHRSECWWYQKIPQGNKKRVRERDFWGYGWPRILGQAPTIIYFALREIESRRQYRAGSLLCVSRKNLHEMTGISLPWCMKCLEILKEYGLITLKKGMQHLWYGKASEVRRILPIPRPKHETELPPNVN